MFPGNIGLSLGFPFSFLATFQKENTYFVVLESIEEKLTKWQISLTQTSTALCT